MKHNHKTKPRRVDMRAYELELIGEGELESEQNLTVADLRRAIEATNTQMALIDPRRMRLGLMISGTHLEVEHEDAGWWCHMRVLIDVDAIDPEAVFELIDYAGVEGLECGTKFSVGRDRDATRKGDEKYRTMRERRRAVHPALDRAPLTHRPLVHVDTRRKFTPEAKRQYGGRSDVHVRVHDEDGNCILAT